jgi:RNA polymerase sigma-70 factor (ECF subfamily)
MIETTASDPEQMIRQARSGDRVARGRLLDQYANYLVLLAGVQIGRRLQGKVDPADLVQETFLEAHRHFEQFRGQTEAELVSWLRHIQVALLANLIRRYFGTKGRDIRLERELTFEADQSSRLLDAGFADGHSSPSQQAVRREQGVLLADALAQLPDDYRITILLRNLEGLPFAEVAQRMGRSEDSVQKLWIRALAQLRRIMGGAS